MGQTHFEFSNFIRQSYLNYYEKKSKTIENIYALSPNYAESQMSGRRKKSIFEVVGHVSSWLFGTASEEDLQAVSGQVSNAVRDGSSGLNEIQHQIDSLATMSKLTNNRIELNNQRTEEIQNQLSGLAVEMKFNLQSVIDYTLLELKNLYLAMDMNEHLQSFLQDLEQLANMKLEPSLVPPAQMKKPGEKLASC